jgi:hypothetical protein
MVYLPRKREPVYRVDEVNLVYYLPDLIGLQVTDEVNLQLFPVQQGIFCHQ